MDYNFDEAQSEEYQNARHLVKNADKNTDPEQLGKAHFTLYLAYKDGLVPDVDVNMSKAHDALIKGIEYKNVPAMAELMAIHLDAHAKYDALPTKAYGLSGTKLGKALGIEINLMQGIDLAGAIILTPEDGSANVSEAHLAISCISSNTFDQNGPNASKSITLEQFNEEEPFCHQNLLLQSRINSILFAEKQRNYNADDFESKHEF